MVRKICKDITGSWKPYDFDLKCTQHGQTRSMGQHLEGAAVNTAGGYVDCPCLNLKQLGDVSYRS